LTKIKFAHFFESQVNNSLTKEAITRKRKGCVTWIIMFRGLLCNYCISITFLKLMMVKYQLTVALFTYTYNLVPRPPIDSHFVKYLFFRGRDYNVRSKKSPIFKSIIGSGAYHFMVLLAAILSSVTLQLLLRHFDEKNDVWSLTFWRSSVQIGLSAPFCVKDSWRRKNRISVQEKCAPSITVSVS
jgi:multidrug transporter EmrE-like cation transporter